MKAIPTKYKGYYFRSRLEARWAVFFDELGWIWEYEPEGFELKSGRYLPDFYLPEIVCYAEVKAKKIEGRDLERIIELSYYKSIILLEGTPDFVSYNYVSEGDNAYEVTMLPHGSKYGSFFHCADFYEDDITISAIVAARSARFEFGEEGGL